MDISFAKNDGVNFNSSYGFSISRLERKNPMEWVRVDNLAVLLGRGPGLGHDRYVNSWCRDSVAKYFTGLVSRTDFRCGHYEGDELIYSQEDKKNFFDIMQFVRGAEEMVCGD